MDLPGQQRGDRAITSGMMRNSIVAIWGFGPQ